MASTLTDAQKIDTFRKMADAWQRKDWRTCADLLAVNGALHSMMKDEPMVGRETFYQRMLTLTSPDKEVTLHIDRIGVIDGVLVVERRDEITVDGVSRSVPVVGILEFDGPHISLWREYYDRAQLVAAQGKTAPKH